MLVDWNDADTALVYHQLAKWEDILRRVTAVVFGLNRTLGLDAALGSHSDGASLYSALFIQSNPRSLRREHGFSSKSISFPHAMQLKSVNYQYPRADDCCGNFKNDLHTGV